MGLTQEQMASVICKDVSAYCRKENGQVKLTIEEWLKMSKFLNVSLDSIYESEFRINLFKETTSDNSVDNLNIYISIKYIKNLLHENEFLKKKIRAYE
ncbi:Helix-turn-helix [Chryseobacterium arachidis]|uniref:Helix-turn-helix n=2 Tax=Chryseobacterium arachidis TaxID=1416778 RepID=A0A1M5CRL9_9FLAO|nr:Helix-turn-helix [Chryseobacterium arachidis]